MPQSYLPPIRFVVSSNSPKNRDNALNVIKETIAAMKSRQLGDVAKFVQVTKSKGVAWGRKTNAVERTMISKKFRWSSHVRSRMETNLSNPTPVVVPQVLTAEPIKKVVQFILPSPESLNHRQYSNPVPHEKSDKELRMIQLPKIDMCANIYDMILSNWYSGICCPKVSYG